MLMPDNAVFLFVLAVAAPFIGSFLGVLAMRLPQHRTVVAGRSHCEHCGHVLGVLDLIPLVSWATSRGKCRYCSAQTGLFYPVIEIAALCVVLWAATVTSGWILAASCLFGWILLALSFADWRSGVLPDVLTGALLVSGLAIAFAIEPSEIWARLAGVAAGFAFMAVLRLLYRILRKKDGLGFGDAKMLGAIGGWVSWNGLPTVILFASGLALLFVLFRARGEKALSGDDRLSFGPFLAMGAWLVWLYGPLGPG